MYKSLYNTPSEDGFFEDASPADSYYNYMLSKKQLEISAPIMINSQINIMEKNNFTTQDAIEIAKQLGINFNKEKFDFQQFRLGLDTELEHGGKYLPTNVTKDDPITTGKIALSHLREFPDYYTRLAKLEEEAKAYWVMMGKKDYTPDEWVMYINPLVKRALAEYKEGINLEHLFEEFILSGVLVGLGKTPQEAIEQVERWENTGESDLLKKSKMKK